MPFYVDLSTISTDQLREKLRNADLVPSRELLKNDIDAVFDKLAILNINNTAQLFEELKTKSRVQNFSKKSQIDENYLTILIRELKGYRQPPVNIKDFPQIDENLAEALEKKGVKNTLQLFDLVTTKEKRNQLANEINFNSGTILYLSKLTDLSRARWVNHTFAFILFHSGVESIEQLQVADPELLHQAVNDVNKKYRFYGGKIGLHDIQLTINAAQELTNEFDF